MAENTALPTEEEIDQMKLRILTRLLQELGMTEEEIDDLEIEEARTELKKRIRDIWAAAATSKRPGQAAENLRDILHTHHSKRERLAELCYKITAYLPSLDERVKDKLKTQFGREVEDISKGVQSQLDKDECPILITGETSAGKSTFLSLLLGEDILPVAHMCCTATICEVKYGETKQAKVHLHHPTDQRQRQITIPLDGTKEQKQELEHYMYLEGASQDSLPLAEKVEIFWPLPLLKGGIVLVDSPGVGESEMMDSIVADYIPKSFAFLYIIDSYRAGGVQQDRLGQLLQLFARKDNSEDFNPESAMFICNKWDLVPLEDQEEVKRDTFRKLSYMWPGLEESQVFFVSTKKAVGLGGILSEDFTKVLDGLDLLLQKSLDNKLETQYRMLTRLLSAALVHIKVQISAACQHLSEDKLRKYHDARRHLQSFQESHDQSTKDLNTELEKNVETTKSVLSDLVENGKLEKDVKALQLKLVSLPDGSITMRDQDREVVKRGQDFSMLKDLYEANILALCDSFERSVKPKEILYSFKGKLKEVANSLEKAQQQAMSAITGSPCPVFRMEVRDILSQHKSRFRGLRMAYLRLSGRLSVERTFLSKWEASSSTVSILHNCWKQAPEGTPLVDILVQALSSSEELITELADRQMQPQRDLMALLEADITKMRTIMEQTIDQTFKDTRNNEEIVQTYEPQSTDINSFLGQMAMFHLTEMRRYEYDLDSITGWTDTRNRLGGGSFGEVFQVQVPWKGGETQEAALKLMSCNMITTGAGDALNFLKEGDNLRKLRGDHIVEYYGTAYKKERGGLRLGLVMELCEGTLEDRIIGQRDHNPAWWGSDPEKQAAAFSYTQNLAVQLFEGLKTIHDAGYIHRDLKLSNVLVTKDDTVKLADVGLTKREDKITGTVAGTPLYTAPEVKERKVYDKSADIYSLGLILLEMWYGQLYGHQDAAYAKQMEEALKEGRVIEMPQWQGTDPPTREWTRLIHDCLKDPKERPKIQECLDRMKAMHCQNFTCMEGAAGRQRDNRKGISGIERDSGATGQPTRREKSSRRSHHPKKPTSLQMKSLTSSQRTTWTRPKSSRGNSETLGTEQTDSAAGRQRDNRKGISGIERDSGATALVHREHAQSGKLLELQKQVTDIVRESHPNLNFVPDTNKEADERRIELNRRTLQKEVFSSSVEFSLDSDIFQLIERRMRSVCCINWPGGAGTGFLLSKGKVLTCDHVYKMMNRASSSFHEASHYCNTATFSVSVGSKYEVPFEAPAALRICHSEELDYAILQLAVSGEMERNLEGLPFLGQCISESTDCRKMVVLVGHPHGGKKVVDFARIAGVALRYIIHMRYPNLIQEDERKPLYDTSVMFHGSSGSPGFDTQGDLVLMHTRGFYPDNSSKSVVERGTRLTAIRDHARQTLAPEVFNEIFPATLEQETPMETN